MHANIRSVRTFPTTNWQLVLTSRRNDAPVPDDSVAELCAVYWYPVYAFLRRRGYRADEAEDLAQGFFAHILGSGLLTRAQPEKGRLRSLLLAALTHFVSNEHERRRARKRRDPIQPAREPLGVEARYAREPADHLTPERVYERRWAAALLTHVLDRLKWELAASGKARLFDLLKEHVLGEPDDTAYRNAATALNLSTGAVRVAAHRLRRRYRELLRTEIGRTVDGSDREIDDEIRYLIAVTQP
jgi:DNA-directed RNA polymerase specialized sigma24 family protein